MDIYFGKFNVLVSNFWVLLFSLKGIMKELCPICSGYGLIYYKIPHYERVTREMARDAGDLSYEGDEVQFGEDEIKELCQNCDGTGEINVQSNL